MSIISSLGYKLSLSIWALLVVITIGYMLAALGSLFIGLVFDITNSSDINNFIFLIMGVLLSVFGPFAAKGEYIEDTL